MAIKHVPQRSCIICGTKLPKRELIRIVHTPQGQFILDESGKQSGRGAYICHNPLCWEQAQKSNRLSRALRTEVPNGAWQELTSQSASLR